LDSETVPTVGIVIFTFKYNNIFHQPVVFLSIFLSTHLLLSTVDETSMFIKPLNVDQCYMFFFGGGEGATSHTIYGKIKVC
jgi:hypothetical protein